jgi:hypothetical protein
LTLGVSLVFSVCASFGVSASWIGFSYASSDMSTFIPSGVGYWVSSTMGVGFNGVVLWRWDFVDINDLGRLLFAFFQL